MPDAATLESDSTSLALIDRFVEALWIEDGLSANTLDAYRRDLALYASLAGNRQHPRDRRQPRIRSARLRV